VAFAVWIARLVEGLEVVAGRVDLRAGARILNVSVQFVARSDLMLRRRDLMRKAAIATPNREWWQRSDVGG